MILGAQGKETKTKPQASAGHDPIGNMIRSLQVVVIIALAQACTAGQPKPAENAFIKVEVAGQTIKTAPPHGATLGYAFSFTLKKPLHLTRVRIDDITTNLPIQLVDDKDPELKKNNLWAGD